MEINIDCRLFFKQNSLTLFHCSLMFKAKCEYWARFTISYVDFVTYIISREVTLKSIEPDWAFGVDGRSSKTVLSLRIGAVRSQSFLYAEGSFGLPCGGYDQVAQAGLGLYRAQ